MSEIRELLAAVGSIIGISLDLLLTGGDLLLSVSDLLFTAVAITQGTIAGQVEWLDEDRMLQLLLGVAALYLTNLALRMRDRLNEETS